MSPDPGITGYVEVDKGYFEKRSLTRYAGIWSLWALGRWRCHIRPFLGLELWPGHRRMGWSPGRIGHHGRHVPVPCLLYRRDERSTSPHRGILLLRPHRHGDLERLLSRVFARMSNMS